MSSPQVSLECVSVSPGRSADRCAVRLCPSCWPYRVTGDRHGLAADLGGVTGGGKVSRQKETDTPTPVSVADPVPIFMWAKGPRSTARFSPHLWKTP